MLASRRLTPLLISILVVAAGCSGTSTSASAPPAPPVAGTTSPPTPTVAAAPSATTVPSPTPVAIKDGEPWIVYQWLQDCDGDNCDQQGVFLVRPDGRDKHPLLTDPASLLTDPATHPDWSPDGKRIVVATEPSEGMGELWTVNADGTDAKLLIACPGAPCMYLGAPAWSSDGTRIAFQRVLSDPGPGTEIDQIDVMDLATGATHVVAMPPVAGSEVAMFINPRWSPDGTEIVFTVMRYPTPPTDENIVSSSIAVVKADGSEADAPRILTDPAMFGSYPDWSPDGKRIVFNTYPLGSFQDTTKATNLYTIAPDGTGLTQVTHFGENDTRASQPTWTPDGKRITFMHIARTTSDPWGDRHIAIIDADGSNLTMIPVPPGPGVPSGDMWSGTHARMRPTP
jgi:Tol biopolymer transport system component